MYSRTRERGTGCPFCAKESNTSFPEQAIFFYLKQIFPDAVNSEKTIIRMDLDIYIPSLHTAIEYDSFIRHNEEKRINRELRKNQLCKEKGITLIRLRETGLNSYSDCICIFRKENKSKYGLTDLIWELFDYLNVSADVDLDRDSIQIWSQYITKPRKNNLTITHPELAAQWHPTKNGTLTPEMVTCGMSKKVWWLEEYGIERQIRIADKVNRMERKTIQ